MLIHSLRIKLAIAHSQLHLLEQHYFVVSSFMPIEAYPGFPSVQKEDSQPYSH